MFARFCGLEKNLDFAALKKTLVFPLGASQSNRFIQILLQFVALAVVSIKDCDNGICVKFSKQKKKVETTNKQSKLQNKSKERKKESSGTSKQRRRRYSTRNGKTSGRKTDFDSLAWLAVSSRREFFNYCYTKV